MSCPGMPNDLPCYGRGKVRLRFGLRVKSEKCFSSLHPLCGGGDLLFLLSPPAAAAATCFCSHSKTPTRIISKYLQYAYTGPGEFV